MVFKQFIFIPKTAYYKLDKVSQNYGECNSIYLVYFYCGCFNIIFEYDIIFNVHE